MAAKLPKPGHVPVIGRREVVLACVYVIGPDNGDSATPLKIGACADLARYFKTLQGAHWNDLRLHDAFWVPDYSVANRVAAGAHSFMRKDGLHIRGEWFAVSAKTAAHWIKESARGQELPGNRRRGERKALSVPLLTNDQYRKICQSPKQLRENEFTNFLRSCGIT
jgi:hypothetical protein